MRHQVLLLFASVALATKAPKRALTRSSQVVAGHILASDTCPTGYEVCDFDCILEGRVCCNDGTGSCDPGYYCMDNGCCPEGEIVCWPHIH